MVIIKRREGDAKLEIHCGAKIEAAPKTANLTIDLMSCFKACKIQIL